MTSEDIRDLRILEMHGRGISPRMIARAVGCSVGHVYRVIREAADD